MTEISTSENNLNQEFINDITFNSTVDSSKKIWILYQSTPNSKLLTSIKEMVNNQFIKNDNHWLVTVPNPLNLEIHAEEFSYLNTVNYENAFRRNYWMEWSLLTENHNYDQLAEIITSSAKVLLPLNDILVISLVSPNLEYQNIYINKVINLLDLGKVTNYQVKIKYF